MKFIYRISSILLLAAAIAGCCNCRSIQRKTRKPLVGTEWQLIQLGGRTMQTAEEQYTICFMAEENRLTGVGDCNRIMASYRLGEDRALTIENPATTRMLCPDDATERAFVEALSATTHYDMDGPTLMLFSKGDLLAVFRAKPEPAADLAAGTTAEAAADTGTDAVAGTPKETSNDAHSALEVGVEAVEAK